MGWARVAIRAALVCAATAAAARVAVGSPLELYGFGGRSVPVSSPSISS